MLAPYGSNVTEEYTGLPLFVKTEQKTLIQDEKRKPDNTKRGNLTPTRMARRTF